MIPFIVRSCQYSEGPDVPMPKGRWGKGGNIVAVKSTEGCANGARMPLRSRSLHLSRINHQIDVRKKHEITYLFLHPNPLRCISCPTCFHFLPNLALISSNLASSSGAQSSFLRRGSRASRYRLEHASSVLPGICLAIKDHFGP